MSSVEIPKWYQLLKHWQDVKRRDGLSFSFLVGATRNPLGSKFRNEQEAKTYSRNLYNEMAREVVECRSAHTYTCLEIGGYGFRLDSGEPSVDLDFEDLWVIYGEGIVAGRYSIENKTFTEISAVDAAWIKAALSS